MTDIERIVLMIVISVALISLAVGVILTPNIEYNLLVKKYGKETAEKIWRRINMI